MAAAQPSGTVTLVFTDIEGSTRLLEELGVDRYRAALAEHRRVVREACGRHDGYEVDYEGDAFFYAFGSAQAAVSAASEFMAGLEGGPIRIRVGIHTGEPTPDPPKYVGIDVHRAARIMAAAHGGQVVLSRETAELLDGSLELKDLGDHRFKDLGPAERIYQLGRADHPPLGSLYRVDLPVPATPFLGREQELAEVVARLADPDIRLLTLTGPGGTGKTRLAIEAASRARASFPDGVTWVALAPFRDPMLVLPTIARELRLSEQPGEPLVETLARALLGKKALLLLDNAEHLLPDLARHLATLTAACPTLRLLVTSRERLQLTAETTWQVPTLNDADGAELFTRRARAVADHFEPSDVVPRICARLDQLPLAIELAAARTRTLSADAILERLDRRLPLLTSSAHDVDDRQRTLAATIAWSYDLLEPEERRALRALSIFAGGWTLEAARVVAGADLDRLESLLDKSLVRRRLDTDGTDRYWMLETIREFAVQRLDAAGETHTVVERLLDWLDPVVGAVDELWVTRDQREWFRTLERERPNLVQAVALARAHGRGDRALRLLVAAAEFVDTWGPYGLFAGLLEGAVCGAPAIDGRARLLYLRLLLRLGRFSDASAAADAAMAGLQDDPVLMGRLLSLRAFNALYQGRPQEALPLAEQGLEQARRAGDLYGSAEALNSLAVAEMTLGDRHAAHAHLLEAEALSAANGDRRNVGIAQANLGLLLLTDRRPAEAVELLREVTDSVRALEGPAMTAMQIANLAIAHAASGDGAAARAALREAIELDAVQHEVGLAVEGLLLLAIAAVHDGAPDLATRLWAAGTAGRASLEYVVGPELGVYVSDLLEPLRARPGFEHHWERGRALSIDEALELGLEPAVSPG